MTEYAEIIAAFTARVILGLLFFFQGYDKLFNIKIPGVVRAFENDYRARKVPDFLVHTGALVTSILELAGGLLLILGLFKYVALYLLAFDLIIAVAGLSFLNPMWDTRHVLPRLILLIFLLIIPNEWDQWVLDRLF